jgi:UDP-glucose 4-epimerase
MIALVTGGAGFIGSNLVDALIDKGWEVRVIDNESSDAHEQFYYNPKAKYFTYCITDYDNTRELYNNVNYVFHLAAESRIQPAIQNPIYATNVNVGGTCTVLQCSREAGVRRVIYSSTSAAYGLENKPPLVETMPKDCLNPYSVTKTAGEELCKIYNNLFGLETITFRYFNVYGPRQCTRGQYAPVIGLFLRQKANGEPMTVVGDGLQTRDYTHVKDVVQANILATECTEGLGEIINIGTGKSYSILDVVNIIGGDHIHIDPRPGECRHTRANNEKAKKVLNWKPTETLENYLK